MKHFSRLLAAALVLSAGSRLLAEDDPNKAVAEYQKKLEKAQAEMAKLGSHEQVAEIKVKGPGGTSLQTLCLDAAGRVLGLVAAPRLYGAPIKDATSEVHVFTTDGKPVTKWTVPFHANAINAGPDGAVYVAGDAKVARFDKDGQPVGEPIELPHIATLLKNQESMRKAAEATLKKEKEMMAKSMGQAKKQFEDKVQEIEAKPEDERTKTEKRQLTQYQSILKSYEESEQHYAKRTVDDVLKSMTARLRIINGIAVSETDVFVACGEVEGWGYAVWRLDRDLTNPTKILSEIGGCCGQMDVQVQGTDLLVAENTKHQFARYTRNGEKVGGYGKRGEDTNPACFGGCCNPMNVRACGADILTAESEGVVKRFSPAGEFVGVVGTVKISGGCKNVAIGVSADGGRVYFCDQPGSRFFILNKKADAKFQDDTDDKPAEDKTPSN